MKIPTPIAIVLVAATATATARPEEFDGRVRMGERDQHRARGQHDWARLATPTPSKFGTEYIIVGKDAGSFRTLRFDLDSGSVFLRQVQILSHNRVTQTIYVQRSLDAGRQRIYVDLETPKSIDELVVTTSISPAGSYSVFGSSATFAPPREVAER